MTIPARAQWIKLTQVLIYNFSWYVAMHWTILIERYGAEKENIKLSDRETLIITQWSRSQDDWSQRSERMKHAKGLIMTVSVIRAGRSLIRRARLSRFLHLFFYYYYFILRIKTVTSGKARLWRKRQRYFKIRPPKKYDWVGLNYFDPRAISLLFFSSTLHIEFALTHVLEE